MPSRQFLRPYAALAAIEHMFDAGHVDIYLIFKFPMDQTVKPAHAKWICEVNEVEEDVTASAWQDEFTLLLTVAAIATRPSKVTIEYDGPDSTLRTTWFKQWEPWGAILSDEIQPVISTITVSAGPAINNDVDVSNVNTVLMDCSANTVPIGGFKNGINGQSLRIARLCASVNAAILFHINGTSEQDIYLHAGALEALAGEYGGWVLVCNGSDWYDCSHAKHV